MSKTHWKKAFKSPYLGSWDLEDYKDLTLTIDHVELKRTKGLKDDAEMNIAHFKEKGYKPMILNSTNSQTVKMLTGSNYIEDWKDVRVTLYVLEGIRAFGGVHDGLRIRTVTTETKTNELPILNEKSDKWQGAVDGLKAGTVDLQTIMQYYKVGKKELIILKDIKKDEQKN